MNKISPTLSKKIAAANVVFTLLIVWHHLSWNYGLTHITTISGIAVPSFFALSAFLYFINFDFSEPYSSYKSKLRKRTYGLIVPWAVYSIIGLIFWLIASKVNGGGRNPLTEIPEMGVIKYFYTCRPNGPLWYLLALYSFILIAPILGLIIKRTRYSIFLVIPLFLLCRDMSYNTFPYWIANIFFGSYIAIYFEEIRGLRIFKVNYILPIILIACISLLLAIEDPSLWRSIVPVCVLGIVFALNRFIPERLIASLLFLAPYSLMIYCLHLPVSRLMQRVPGMIGISNPVLQLIAACILTVALIVMTGYIIRKKELVWSIATGGR